MIQLYLFYKGSRHLVLSLLPSSDGNTLSIWHDWRVTGKTQAPCNGVLRQRNGGRSQMTCADDLRRTELL